MTARLRAALMFLGLLAVGCGSLVGSGVREDLRGRTYLSTQVSENGQPRPLVAGTRIRLRFSDDGRRISLDAGCNNIAGDASIERDRLVVRNMASTAMGCDPPRHEQDEWLSKVVSGSPEIRASGPDLVLSSGTTELRLKDREVADPDRPLVGTRWVVETIVDRDIASSVPQGATAYAILGSDGTFVGSTGCNEMGGSATPASKTIRFANVFTTKMACQQDRMRLEQAVLTVLRDEVGYEIEADLLRLRHPTGKGLDLRAER